MLIEERWRMRECLECGRQKREMLVEEKVQGKYEDKKVG